ncbi:MAG: PorV/PorQ family protein [Ignavibacteriales bacterium]|nr:PorV/PorQ family protein [Ignavibacteriales bacterium]
MIRYTVFAALLLFALSSAKGQGSSTSSSQLKIPLTARSAALGESTVSDPGQFSSWSINPANLFSDSPLAIALTHSQWMQEIQTEFLAARIPIASGSLGIGVSTNSVPGIEIRDVPGPSLGTFSARFASFQIGYAQNLTDDIILGASAKYLYEKLYVDEASGFGFDAGMIYNTPIQGLKAGFAVTNIGGLQQFQNDRSDLPTFSRIGASYAFRRDDFDFSVLGAWAHNLRDPENHAQASLEASYSQKVSLRFGYQTGYESRALSAGIGIRFEFIQLDYAYVPFALGLGDSHLFSLGFQF